MLWLVLLILLVILILLLYLIIVTSPGSTLADLLPVDRNTINTSLKKANQFIQDICVQIDLSESYIVLPGDTNTIENNHIYINIYGKEDFEIYTEIIRLLANDLNIRHGIKDTQTTVKRIEQSAYTLGYL